MKASTFFTMVQIAITATLSVPVSAQDKPSAAVVTTTGGSTSPAARPPLPEMVGFYLYPTALNGKRGWKVDITDIDQSGKVITAKATMRGKGQNGCVLENFPVTVSYEEGGIATTGSLPPDGIVNGQQICAPDFSIRMVSGKVVGGTYPRGTIKPD